MELAACSALEVEVRTLGDEPVSDLRLTLSRIPQDLNWNLERTATDMQMDDQEAKGSRLLGASSAFVASGTKTTFGALSAGKYQLTVQAANLRSQRREVALEWAERQALQVILLPYDSIGVIALEFRTKSGARPGDIRGYPETT